MWLVVALELVKILFRIKNIGSCRHAMRRAARRNGLHRHHWCDGHECTRCHLQCLAVMQLLGTRVGLSLELSKLAAYAVVAGVASAL